MNKVNTDLTHEADDAIGAKVEAIIVGCTGNVNFTVTTQLTAVVTAKSTYVTALGLCTHGDEA